MNPLPLRRRDMLGGLGAAALAGCVSVKQNAPSGASGLFDRAFEFSAESGGDAVVVMREGRTIYRRFGEGRGPAHLAPIASATKSFWGPAVAAMIADGRLAGWDEPAVTYLPEWRDDPVKRRITLRHLLSLSSGLRNDIAALQGNGTARDKFAYSLTMPIETEPGTKFQYGPVNFYVLGAIMQRRLAPDFSDPLAYLTARILRPVGITRYDWLRDPSGNPHMPNGAAVPAEEWANFGEFVRLRGRWSGRQIVPAALMDELLRPSPANPAYGLTWWLNTPGGTTVEGMESRPDDPGGGILRFGEPDIAAAIGAGRNGLYVIPGRRLVVVRQRPYAERAAGMTFAEHARNMRQAAGNWSDDRFLTLVLEGAGG